MLKTNNTFINFLSFLLPFIAITATLHLLILKTMEKPIYDNKIILAYIANISLAVIIFFGIYLIRKQQESNLGFIFLLGSFLKFGIFFLVFYPEYKIDGTIQRIEFVTFFTPYAICLIIEVYFLAKLLNNN